MIKRWIGEAHAVGESGEIAPDFIGVDLTQAHIDLLRSIQQGMSMLEKPGDDMSFALFQAHVPLFTTPKGFGVGGRLCLRETGEVFLALVNDDGDMYAETVITPEATVKSLEGFVADQESLFITGGEDPDELLLGIDEDQIDEARSSRDEALMLEHEPSLESRRSSSVTP